MKKYFLLLAAVAVFVPGGEAQERRDEPVQVAYYYRVRWGFQEEFERLYMKNHYPVLAAQLGGRIREVRLYRPRFHGDGRSDWTFLSVITFSSWETLGASEEARIARQLFPDQETFRREEQRRFEIVDAHWDVPLAEIPPPK